MNLTRRKALELLATTAATGGVSEMAEQAASAQQTAGGAVTPNWLGNEAPQLPVGVTWGVAFARGTDVCVAAMTEWERTGDTRYRDKIVAGMDSITAMPYGFLSGPNQLYGYDPKTGKMGAIVPDGFGAYKKIRQKNSWVDSGSGSLPSE